MCLTTLCLQALTSATVRRSLTAAAPWFFATGGRLYVAVGHPGVILVPLIGRLTAEEIVDGRRTELIPCPK